MSLTSIHIQDSYTPDIASIPPEPNEDLSQHTVSESKPMTLLGVLLFPFYWLLKIIWKCFKYYVLIWVVILALILAGALSSVAFPFLLASLVVLRLSQFVKRGEEYDKVTQVKMVVEWYLVINIVLLAFGIFLFCTLVRVNVFGLNILMGKPLLEWARANTIMIIIIFGIRFILFWIIQKYMPRMTLEHNESGLKVIQANCDIVDCLIFWVLVIPIMDSNLKDRTLAWTTIWITVSVFIVIGWNIIALSTHLIIWSTHKLVSRYFDQAPNDKERSQRYILLERLLSVKWLVYYGNGIKRSFNFMLSSLLFLLVWVLYFGPHLKEITDNSDKVKTVRDFGTWTCTVLLILSFFWVVKDFVLLSWEANAVYNRLSSQIVEAMKSLYFLGILGRHTHDILKLRYEVTIDEDSATNKAQIFVAKNLGGVDHYYRDKMDEDDTDEMVKNTEGDSSQLKPKLSNKKRARVKHDLLLPKNDTMTMFNIQQVAQYFLNAANALSEETYTYDILGKMTPVDNSQMNACFTEEDIEKLITWKNNVSDEGQSSSESVQPDWKYFQGLLCLNSSDYHIEVKKWLERSHNKCRFLANTLCSAQEVVDCLNNIISVLLICACFILWLIFTGLADIKVLVLIGSPLLAATFVFGDTCKSLFQGIIFVYVVHPFDVGDLCVIDEKLMEVKSIGVWKTIFSNIDKARTHEEVIYPNSELAMKMFINHKTKFDWNDSVEFDVQHLDKQQIKELKKEIENILNKGRDESMPGTYSVAVLSTGKDIKISVRFRHDKQNEDMTYFECVKMKDNLRSEFILDVQNFQHSVHNSVDGFSEI